MEGSNGVLLIIAFFLYPSKCFITRGSSINVFLLEEAQSMFSEFNWIYYDIFWLLAPNNLHKINDNGVWFIYYKRI